MDSYVYFTNLIKIAIYNKVIYDRLIIIKVTNN